MPDDAETIRQVCFVDMPFGKKMDPRTGIEIHFDDATIVAFDTAIPDALAEPIDALSQLMNALVTG